MAREISATTSAGFETLCHLGVIADLGDGRLIERFLAAEGVARELAFRALVDRHGPIVVRACRSVLRDEHEAQDVAQEVFLTLARRAATLRRREAIGPWLHRVSLRAALRARRGSARRARVGVALPETIPAVAGGEAYDDASEILHQEVDRLPRRAREAIVACDLEGLAYAAAAARLGLPVRSIAERQAELGDCDGAATTLATIPEGDRTPPVLLKLARGYAIDGREDRASEFLAQARANGREPPADFEKALFDDPPAARASLDVIVPQLAYLDRVEESVALVRGLPDEQERQTAFGGVVQIQAERGAFDRALRLARAGELRVRPTLPYKYLANGVRWRLEAEARLKAARRESAR